METILSREARARRAKHIAASATSRLKVDRSVPRDGITSYVYFAYSAGRIKIGTSASVLDRGRGLSTQSPHPVTIILMIPGNVELEQRLHECLMPYRVNGEWFKLTRDMRNLLKLRLCAAGMRKFRKAETEFRQWLVAEGYAPKRAPKITSSS